MADSRDIIKGLQILNKREGDSFEIETTENYIWACVSPDSLTDEDKSNLFSAGWQDDEYSWYHST